MYVRGRARRRRRTLSSRRLLATSSLIASLVTRLGATPGSPSGCAPLTRKNRRSRGMPRSVYHRPTMSSVPYLCGECCFVGVSVARFWFGFHTSHTADQDNGRDGKVEGVDALGVRGVEEGEGVLVAREVLASEHHAADVGFAEGQGPRGAPASFARARHRPPRRARAGASAGAGAGPDGQRAPRAALRGQRASLSPFQARGGGERPRDERKGKRKATRTSNPRLDETNITVPSPRPLSQVGHPPPPARCGRWGTPRGAAQSN